jgi:hypothetical protein
MIPPPISERFYRPLAALFGKLTGVFRVRNIVRFGGRRPALWQSAQIKLTGGGFAIRLPGSEGAFERRFSLPASRASSRAYAPARGRAARLAAD